MDNSEFHDSVQRMRNLQNEYFRSRNGLVLQRAKEAERAVDKALNAYYASLADPEIQAVRGLSCPVMEHANDPRLIGRVGVRDGDTC